MTSDAAAEDQILQNAATATITEDLWPTDLGAIDVVPPVAVLREQADLLSQRTRHLVEGVVITEEGANDSMVHSLFLRAPQLNGYRFRLISLLHAADGLYPVHITYDAAQGYDSSLPSKQQNWSAIFSNAGIADEAVLRQRLRHTFNAEETRRVLQNLLTQSQAVTAA